MDEAMEDVFYRHMGFGRRDRLSFAQVPDISVNRLAVLDSVRRRTSWLDKFIARWVMFFRDSDGYLEFSFSLDDAEYISLQAILAEKGENAEDDDTINYSKLLFSLLRLGGAESGRVSTGTVSTHRALLLQASEWRDAALLARNGNILVSQRRARLTSAEMESKSDECVVSMRQNDKRPVSRKSGVSEGNQRSAGYLLNAQERAVTSLVEFEKRGHGLVRARFTTGGFFANREATQERRVVTRDGKSIVGVRGAYVERQTRETLENGRGSRLNHRDATVLRLLLQERVQPSAIPVRRRSLVASSGRSGAPLARRPSERGLGIKDEPLLASEKFVSAPRGGVPQKLRTALFEESGVERHVLGFVRMDGLGNAAVDVWFGTIVSEGAGRAGEGHDLPPAADTVARTKRMPAMRGATPLGPVPCDVPSVERLSLKRKARRAIRQFLNMSQGADGMFFSWTENGTPESPSEHVNRCFIRSDSASEMAYEQPKNFRDGASKHRTALWTLRPRWLGAEQKNLTFDGVGFSDGLQNTASAVEGTFRSMARQFSRFHILSAGHRLAPGKDGEVERLEMPSSSFRYQTFVGLGSGGKVHRAALDLSDAAVPHPSRLWMSDLGDRAVSESSAVSIRYFTKGEMTRLPVSRVLDFSMMEEGNGMDGAGSGDTSGSSYLLDERRQGKSSLHAWAAPGSESRRLLGAGAIVMRGRLVVSGLPSPSGFRAWETSIARVHVVPGAGPFRPEEFRVFRSPNSLGTAGSVSGAVPYELVGYESPVFRFPGTSRVVQTSVRGVPPDSLVQKFRDPISRNNVGIESLGAKSAAYRLNDALGGKLSHPQRTFRRYGAMLNQLRREPTFVHVSASDHDMPQFGEPRREAHRMYGQSSVEMMVVAALQPSEPSMEQLMPPTGERPRAKGSRREPDSEAAARVEHSMTHGTIDALAQRIYHRLKRRLAAERECAGV